MLNTALKVFANNRFAAKFWFAAFVIMIFLSLAQGAYIVNSFLREREIVVVDDAGVFHVAAAQNYKKALKVKELCLIFAVRAFFNRNPDGFDTPELLKQMYLVQPAMRHVQRDFEASKKRFKRFSMHQKAEILSKRFYNKGQFLMARADLLLVINGKQGKRNVRENKKIDVVFMFARNKRMEENGRLPYAVYDYDIIEEGK